MYIYIHTHICTNLHICIHLFGSLQFSLSTIFATRIHANAGGCGAPGSPISAIYFIDDVNNSALNFWRHSWCVCVCVCVCSVFYIRAIGYADLQRQCLPHFNGGVCVWLAWPGWPHKSVAHSGLPMRLCECKTERIIWPSFPVYGVDTLAALAVCSTAVFNIWNSWRLLLLCTQADVSYTNLKNSCFHNGLQVSVSQITKLCVPTELGNKHQEPERYLANIYRMQSSFGQNEIGRAGFIH